jgi:rRNA maturation endonuclease Nob1
MPKEVKINGEEKMSEKQISVRYSNKCSHCNTYMRVVLSICPTCGREINHSESNNSYENGGNGAKTNFGEDDFLTCPSCRVVNSLEFEKCQTCGYQLLEPSKLKSIYP